MSKTNTPARKILSAADILGANDKKVVYVDCPEWGGEVGIKAMSGTERDTFEQSMYKREGKKIEAVTDNIRARLVCMTAVDGNGDRLFTDAQLKELGEKSAAALDRCFDAAKDLNGMFDGDVEEAKKD